MDAKSVPSFFPESRMGTLDLLVLRQITELTNMLTASPVTADKSSMVQA
ncbi:MAG: hypothetical protein HZA19_06975 [Nitrospirae bacterium]|nr:hypothetical protein [Nitrospirota bacterium]